MSKHTTTTYQCPNCKKSSNVTIWQSINVDLDPEMRERVLDESAFTFVCPSCGFRQGLAYASLYHDLTLKFMVYWLPAANETKHQDFAELNKSAIQEPGYRLRVVSTLNRMKEKILIFGHRMDDRAIELLKRFMWSSYLEDIGTPRNKVYFSGANLQSEYPEIELVAITDSGQSRTFKVGGKNGYPRALEILHRDFKVPTHDVQQWKIVDHTYWDLAEKGKG
jgi:predicted RNA-binding Zn-ribbon protein involved in translation (DUF1610 family)